MAEIHTTRTIDHDEIRTWSEDRGGSPALAGSTRGEDGAMLRIDFGLGEETLEETSWDEFFRVFENNDLAFVYQDTTEEGDLSYHYRFVSRSGEDESILDDTDEANFGQM